MYWMASNEGVTELPINETVAEFEFILEDYTQRVIIFVILIVVFFVGIPGNTLVILAVTLSHRLRLPTYLFVANLAATDLITCLVLPFHMLALLSRQGWPLPAWICSVTAEVSFICVTSSTSNLALIAFNRWYLLTQPVGLFQKTFKPKKVYLMAIFAWLYSILLVIVPPLAGVGGLGYSYKFKTCSVDNSSHKIAFYKRLLGVGMFLVPAFPILTCYILIHRFVRRHTLKMASRVNSQPISADGTSHTCVLSSSQVELEILENGQGSSSSTKERSSTESSREHVTITKKLALIVCIFVVCYIPIMICSVVSSEATDPVDAWGQLLAVVNSCLNPIIYARTIPAFRDVMGCILRCRLGKIPERAQFIRRFRGN